MNEKIKRIVFSMFLIYGGINIFVFLLSHFATLIESNVIGGIVEYLALYLLMAVEFLALPLLATLVLVIYAYKGTKRAVLAALVLSSAQLFYTIPYYYMQYVYTYDSIDSLFLALFGTLIAVVLSFVGIFILICAAILVLKRSTKMPRKEIAIYLPELLKERSDTDFLSTKNLPLLVFALLKFAFELIKELFDTIMFFVSYGADYSGIEILTMLANYVILFALLIVGYLLSVRIKNQITASATNESTPSEYQPQ